MSIDKLENILADMLQTEDEIFDVLDILIKIVADNHEKSGLTSYKVRLYLVKDQHSRGNISFDDFRLETTRVVNGISDFVRTKLDYVPLVNEWENDNAVKSLLGGDPSEESEETGETDPDDKDADTDPDDHIILPKYAIHLPAELAKDQVLKKEFRLKMTQAQDAIRSGDYNEAHNICVEIAKNIEGESSQLQEFLLISLFKTITANEIVRDYLEEKGGLFSRIKLYAEKIKNLERTAAKKNRGMSTAERNIRRICRLLMIEVKFSYKKKESHNQRIEYSDNEGRPDLRNYYTRIIKLSMDIYSLHPTALFFETLLLELNGGGALDWMYLDQNEKIRDKDGLKFSPTKFRSLLISKYQEEVFVNLSREKFERKASQMLYSRLKSKYRAINRERNEKGFYTWNEGKNRAIFKVIQSFIVGYKLYNDPMFLTIPWNELSGKEKLDWLDIDSDGLTTDKYIKSSLPKFDPLEQLKTLSRIINPANPQDLLNETIEHITFKKFNQIKRTYKKEFKDQQAGNDKSALNKLIQYIKTCKYCNKVSPNAEFLETALLFLLKTPRISLIRKVYLQGTFLNLNSSVCLDLNFDAVREMKSLSIDIKTLKVNFVHLTEKNHMTDVPDDFTDLNTVDIVQEENSTSPPPYPGDTSENFNPFSF
ncbi:MAG: hypothetical protein IT260_00445 [Saprospiraceae bacterium]|nr:hypothetical protein [Saprospiraceae bacterium]